MKMYLFYLKLTLENALKKPQKAFKILPGLGFLLLGIVLFVVGLFIKPNFKDIPEIVLNINLNIGILYITGISSFMLIIYLFSSIFTDNGLGFRASDANLLMKAPIDNFDAYLFVVFKQMILYFGLSLFMLGTQASGIVNLIGDSSVLILGAVLFFSSIFAICFLGYIELYFKLKNKLITKIFVSILLIILIGLIVYAFISKGFLITEFKALYFFPFIGWNLAIITHYIHREFLMMFMYVVIYIVSLITIYIISKKLKFDYYEFELTKVSKTEKQYKKLTQGSNSDLKLFRKSNIEFKNLNDKVLVDYANIVAGKYWFVSLRFLLIIAALMFIPFVIFSVQRKDFDYRIFILALIGIKLYIGSFSIGESEFYNNFYLRLFPIETFKKIIYFHAVKYKLLVIENLTLFVSILFFKNLLKIENFNIFRILVSLLLYTLISLIDIFREHNIIGYFRVKFGQVLTLIVSLIETLVKILLLIGISVALSVYGPKYSEIAFAVIFLLVYLILEIYLSIFIYEKMDANIFKTEQ